MKERPILFSAQMVRAILEGYKMQTRRIVKPQPAWIAEPSVPFRTDDADPSGIIRCPYGQSGDRLWVREAWRVGKGYDEVPGSQFQSSRVWYDASDGTGPHETRAGRYRHALSMPRWASRITLEVTGVRVERLQEINAGAALSEGIKPWKQGGWCFADHACAGSPIVAFEALWDSINAKRAPWASNPWVWVIEFKRVGA